MKFVNITPITVRSSYCRCIELDRTSFYEGISGQHIPTNIKHFVAPACSNSLWSFRSECVYIYTHYIYMDYMVMFIGLVTQQLHRTGGNHLIGLAE
jgi:predicted Zn-dependent protease